MVSYVSAMLYPVVRKGSTVHHQSKIVFAIVGACLLCGCAQTPGEISRDTEPFKGIAPSATITLLGTEPFWGIQIEAAGAGHSARYSSPEDIDGTQFSVTRFAGNNGIGFSGEMRGEPVQIALTPGDCSDAMSDRSYPYTATVALGDTTLFGCGYTSDQPYTGEEAP
jgi:uncharacterized membrane protein